LGLILLQNEGFEDMSSEEESDEDDVSHENRHSLGKRKATTMPSLKPSRKRPEKKTKSTCLRNPYCHSNYVTEGPRVEVEYEQEVESVPPTQSALTSW
jgi:protein MAK16